MMALIADQPPLAAGAFEVKSMLKIPFGRAAKDQDEDTPSLLFSAYCREELERRRDSGEGFDEERFKAAVELAVGRLQAMEADEGKA